MDGRVLVCCKSVTGFTRRYAGVIAREAGGTLMDWKDVSAKTAAPYETMVFGGRFRTGTVDGLKRAKAIARSSGAALMVFATGAMPAGAAEMVLRQTWEKISRRTSWTGFPIFICREGCATKRCRCWTGR